jgi:hypothetical protein
VFISKPTNQFLSLTGSGFAHGVLADGRYYTIFHSDELCDSSSSSTVELFIAVFEHEYDVNHRPAETREVNHETCE